MLIQWRASPQWEVFRSSPLSARDGFARALGSICPDSKESQAMSPPDYYISGCATSFIKLLIFLRRGQHHRPKHETGPVETQSSGYRRSGAWRRLDPANEW
jgi:hypothetical protein